jgi:hypothetical protein
MEYQSKGPAPSFQDQWDSVEKEIVVNSLDETVCKTDFGQAVLHRSYWKVSLSGTTEGYSAHGSVNGAYSANVEFRSLEEFTKMMNFVDLYYKLNG